MVDKNKVAKLIRDIGVPMSLKGYRCAVEAVTIYVNRNDRDMKISSDLYGMVASAHGTTATRVERAIRHAIEVAWDFGDFDLQGEIFGGSVSSRKGKPTNKQFICGLAEYIWSGDDVES